MTAQEREDFLVSMATTAGEVADPNLVIVQNQQVNNTQGNQLTHKQVNKIIRSFANKWTTIKVIH